MISSNELNIPRFAIFGKETLTGDVDKRPFCGADRGFPAAFAGSDLRKINYGPHEQRVKLQLENRTKEEEENRKGAEIRRWYPDYARNPSSPLIEIGNSTMGEKQEGLGGLSESGHLTEAPQGQAGPITFFL
jgi:hypothetical protein